MGMQEVLNHIAVPRPGYSEAFDRTVEYIEATLNSEGIQYSLQEFALKSRLDFIVGLTVALLGILLCVLIMKRRPWAAVLTAVCIPAVLMLELEYFMSVVSWLVTKPASNIIIKFETQNAVRELVFAAHMDSKTALFDHIQRAYIYMLVPAAVIIGIISPFIPGLARRLSAGTGKWLNRLTTAAAVLLAAYWVLFGMSFFGYVFVKNQSPGAVDDAASVAVLIELAKDLNDGKVKPAGSSVTILLTSGEELNLLGALEYVRRFLPEGNTGRKVPVMLVNLDIIGQPGNLAFAERTGVFLRHWPADAGLAAEVGKAWQAVSGRPMETGKSGTDDSVCFLERGIPSVSIYHTGVPGPGLGGYHSAADSIQRVDLKNMEMTLMAMEKMIEGR